MELLYLHADGHQYDCPTIFISVLLPYHTLTWSPPFPSETSSLCMASSSRVRWIIRASLASGLVVSASRMITLRECGGEADEG